MTRVLTPEHKAAMRAGRERHDEEERQRKAERQVAYSAWVREDADLFLAYVSAEGEERVRARAEWVANLRRMPPMP